MKRAGMLLSAALIALLGMGRFQTNVAGGDEPAKSPRVERPRILYTSPRVVAYQLRRLSNQTLVRVDRNTSDPKYRPVYEAMLSRPGLGPQFRNEALKGLSALNKTDTVAELIAGIQRLDQVDGNDTSVLQELGRQLTAISTDDLKRKRAVLEGLATDAKHALARRAALAAVVRADGVWEKARAIASPQHNGLVDLIDALPLIPDPVLRDAFYPQIERLIQRAPNDNVRKAAIRGISYIPGHGAKTFTILADLIGSNQQRESAIISIRRTDKTTWPAARIGPLIESLLAFAETVPTSDRASDIFLETMALGNDLADQLPEDRAESVRKRLRGMGVAVFPVKTIPHQMLYDRTTIEVEAGQLVLIIFENNDTMTHNLIITVPGAHEEVGTAAEAMASEPGARARNYVPVSNKILWATKLLQPGQIEKLSFNAPEEPGVYPYFCTYPGHWRRMIGALYVFADLDQYRANPQTYLSEHPLRISDELLKNDRSRTQWKVEQLVSSLQHLSHGRSFENGKQMFQLANCVSCHRLNDVGHEIGPDLMKLDPKLEPADILRELLEPSKRINEDFYTYTFWLESGIAVTGLIVEETADVVKVAENPAAESRPIVLEKAEIEERAKSTLSIMPNGLLDQLTREEILDLIAYVISRGDRNSKLFHGGHRHE